MALFRSARESKLHKKFLTAELYHGLQFLQLQIWEIGPHKRMARNQEMLEKMNLLLLTSYSGYLNGVAEYLNPNYLTEE